jgi:hypothetical protein
VEDQAEALAEEQLEEAAVWAVDPVVGQRAGQALDLAPECREAVQVDRQG